MLIQIQLPPSPTPSTNIFTDNIATISDLIHHPIIFMLTDKSSPIIHRLSKFLIPSSKSSKLDSTQIPKSAIRYDMCEGVGLGIFATLERCGTPVAGSANQTAITRVYCDEKLMGKCCRNGDHVMKKKRSIFSLRVEEEFEAFPGPEFLSFCNLCRKKLCGKDIYMYRGENAFCSEECREVQIAKDEKKERRRSHGVYGVADIGASSHPAAGRDQMLSTEIFAT